MSTRSLRGASAAVLFASLVCAQAGPDGHWEGSFTVNNREMGLSLDLAKNAKAEWIASMGLPSENATGLVVMNVAVNGKSVKFVAVELQMAPFDLTLGPDGRMKGTISSPQGSLPVEFKRTGEAKVELIQRARRCRRNSKEIGKARSSRPTARSGWYSISRINRTTRSRRPSTVASPRAWWACPSIT